MKTLLVQFLSLCLFSIATTSGAFSVNQCHTHNDCNKNRLAPGGRGTRIMHVVSSKSSSSSISNTRLGMKNILDFFSEEARQEREARKDQLRREQEEAQRQILEMRTNPDQTDAYFEKVKERRKQFENLDDGRKVRLEKDGEE